MPTGTIVEAEIAFVAHQRVQNHSPDTIEHYVWTFIDLHRFLNDSGRDPALLGPLAPAEPFKPFRVLTTSWRRRSAMPRAPCSPPPRSRRSTPGL